MIKPNQKDISWQLFLFQVLCVCTKKSKKVNFATIWKLMLFLTFLLPASNYHLKFQSLLFSSSSNLSNCKPNNEGHGDPQKDFAQKLLFFVLGWSNRYLLATTQGSITTDVKICRENAERKCSNSKRHLESTGTISNTPEAGLTAPTCFRFWESDKLDFNLNFEWNVTFKSKFKFYCTSQNSRLQQQMSKNVLET